MVTRAADGVKRLAHVSFVRMGNVGPGSAAYAFGRRVKTLRTARGWTQDEFARRLTVAGHPMHQTTVAKLELGGRPTDVAEITEIAAIFGIQPAALFEDLSTEEQLRQQLRERRAVLIIKAEECNQLRARLQTLETEYKSAKAEYRRLARKLGEEVNDIG